MLNWSINPPPRDNQQALKENCNSMQQLILCIGGSAGRINAMPQSHLQNKVCRGSHQLRSHSLPQREPPSGLRRRNFRDVKQRGRHRSTLMHAGISRPVRSPCLTLRGGSGSSPRTRPPSAGRRSVVLHLHRTWAPAIRHNLTGDLAGAPMLSRDLFLLLLLFSLF